jgi:exodeoxyribonuclease VII small subunit
MVSAKKDHMKFGEAMAELEEILRRIEGEEIDIDELAAELKKASDLLEMCREKIRRAELEVTQIVQSIDDDATTATGSGEDE